MYGMSYWQMFGLFWFLSGMATFFVLSYVSKKEGTTFKIFDDSQIYSFSSQLFILVFVWLLGPIGLGLSLWEARIRLGWLKKPYDAQPM